MRADKLLQELGLFDSRKKAQVAIEKGLVFFKKDRRPVLKSSEELRAASADEFEILADQELAFVSRAGAKLDGALNHFAVDVTGKICLDVGQSTGGFTDCLLRRGAAFVLGVDAGSGQLHPSLRGHQRILSYEKINAREPLPENCLEDLHAATGRRDFDLMVLDVSFISLLKVAPVQLRHLRRGGEAFVLFKPQFEVGPDNVGKKGLVSREESLPVLEKAVKTLETFGLRVIGVTDSLLKGEDGNQEYFIALRC